MCGRLLGHTERARRGDYAVEIVNTNDDPAIRREILQVTWEHDYIELRRAVGSSDKRFNALFRRAKFDVSHLDFPLTIYRGGSPDDRWIGWGKSWTLSPEIAAWFALAYVRTGRPDNIVVKRILRQRRQVLAHYGGVGEIEPGFARPHRGKRDSHTLIRQRPPTPSCGGLSPYRGENSEPGRHITESLTSNPRVREQPGPKADIPQGCGTGGATMITPTDSAGHASV